MWSPEPRGQYVRGSSPSLEAPQQGSVWSSSSLVLTPVSDHFGEHSVLAPFTWGFARSEICEWVLWCAGFSGTTAFLEQRSVPSCLWAALSAQAKWESLYCYTMCNQCEQHNCKGLSAIASPLQFLLSSLSFRLAVQPCIEASPMVRLITTRLVFCMICSLPWLMLKGNQEGFWNCLLLSSFSFYCGMRGVQAKQKTTIYGVYHTKFFCVTLIWVNEKHDFSTSLVSCDVSLPVVVLSSRWEERNRGHMRIML